MTEVLPIFLNMPNEQKKLPLCSIFKSLLTSVVPNIHHVDPSHHILTHLSICNPSSKNLYYLYLSFFLRLPQAILTHILPMLPFCTPGKRQKTFGFLTFSGGTEM